MAGVTYFFNKQNIVETATVKIASKIGVCNLRRYFYYER